MKQITIRGLDDKLAESIRQLAEKKGISLNKAALYMLHVGAGLPPPPTPKKGPIGNSLDDFIGTMSQEEFEEFHNWGWSRADSHFENVDGLAWVRIPVR